MNGAAAEPSAKTSSTANRTNITNSGTTADFSLSFARDFTPKDRLTLSVRHELSRYELPNERLQQFPQLQDPVPPAGTPPQLIPQTRMLKPNNNPIPESTIKNINAASSAVGLCGFGIFL